MPRAASKCFRLKAQAAFKGPLKGCVKTYSQVVPVCLAKTFPKGQDLGPSKDPLDALDTDPGPAPWAFKKPSKAA